ncbi:membrane protein [Aeromicrobium erythreum]|uniref:Membrane protein n=1 Tax=Aeromicrobium erythreum TaxID=2041 RepID=A0A0U4D4U5_9ACTN|nr:membrane protein [Aeromicrobium erythreum]
MPAVKDEPKAPAASASPAAASASGRQARLRLTHVEPWSVTRLAFVVSVALMIVSVVAVTIFWVVLDLTGIWDQLNGTVSNVLSDSAGSFDLTDYLGLGRLVGLTLIFSAVNVVLMTAIATIAAHLYNLAAQLLGGIEVTFTDH